MQLKKIQIRGRNYSSTLKTQIIEYTYTNSGFNKYEVKINGTTKERYTYDSRNRVTIITDGLGNQIKQEYSGENLYRIYTNGISDQIVYSYSYGKLISATDNYAIVNKTDNGYDTVNYNLNNNNNILCLPSCL